jgi:hypothetical protein
MDHDVGIADLEARPHMFRSEWNEPLKDWEELYILKPLTDREFAAVMAQRPICVRWLKAYRAGMAAKTHTLRFPTIYLNIRTLRGCGSV